jgi:hypothetical protein
MNMNVTEILKDAVRYPFSDWKKILILGIILFISSNVIDGSVSGTRNITEMGLLAIIGFIFGLLVYGYAFKIIKSSLAGVLELPAFDDWVDMFLTGIKVMLVGIVYLIPVILIIIFSAMLYPSTFTLTYGSTGLNSAGIFLEVLGSVIIQGIGNLVPILFNLSETIIWGSIALLYMIIVVPILLMAIANMANNDSKLSAAFRFHEILTKITSIGWENLIMWYMVIGILYLILLVISNIFPSFVWQSLLLLSITPYFYMYLARSMALFYISESGTEIEDRNFHNGTKSEEGNLPEKIEGIPQHLNSETLNKIEMGIFESKMNLKTFIYLLMIVFVLILPAVTLGRIGRIITFVAIIVLFSILLFLFYYRVGWDFNFKQR